MDRLVDVPGVSWYLSFHTALDTPVLGMTMDAAADADADADAAERNHRHAGWDPTAVPNTDANGGPWFS